MLCYVRDCFIRCILFSERNIPSTSMVDGKLSPKEEHVAPIYHPLPEYCAIVEISLDKKVQVNDEWKSDKFKNYNHSNTWDQPHLLSNVTQLLASSQSWSILLYTDELLKVTFDVTTGFNPLGPQMKSLIFFWPNLSPIQLLILFQHTRHILLLPLQ